jgi:LmbE family N-acetylglucosaminyl deacetylase
VLVTVNFYERRRSGDWNTSDHRNVGVALLDAATDAGNPWVFPELVDEGFPPWAGVRCVAVAGSPASGHAVDVTDGMDAGIEALAAHAGYLASLPPDNPMGDTFSPAGTLTDSRSYRGEATPAPCKRSVACSTSGARSSEYTALRRCPPRGGHLA